MIENERWNISRLTTSRGSLRFSGVEGLLYGMPHTEPRHAGKCSALANCALISSSQVSFSAVRYAQKVSAMLTLFENCVCVRLLAVAGAACNIDYGMRSGLFAGGSNGAVAAAVVATLALGMFA